MTNNAADDYETIRRRMEEMKAERDLALTGNCAPVQAEEPKSIESVYGYAGLYGQALGSLAHPAWPYAGTGFEWRRFVRS